MSEPAPQAIKAIIFDCFGVFWLDSHDKLVELFPDKKDILQDIRHQNDYGIFTKVDYLQTLARVVGASPEEVEAIIMGENEINQALVDFVLSELKPHYKIGLLSNVGRGWLDTFFAPHLRNEMFDAVVLSGEEGVTKPHPQMFELIAARLDLEPEACLMIDDLPENAAGADAAGMQAMVYGTMHDLKRDLRETLYARIT